MGVAVQEGGGDQEEGEGEEGQSAPGGAPEKVARGAPGAARSWQDLPGAAPSPGQQSHWFRHFLLVSGHSCHTLNSLCTHSSCLHIKVIITVGPVLSSLLTGY